jgi:hypothetical protein
MVGDRIDLPPPSQHAELLAEQVVVAAKIVSSTLEVIKGTPDPKHISTSYAERLNWSTRTSMRRYTRLSNGFSPKLESHEAAVALNYFAYNFIRIHRTMRVTPAMAARLRIGCSTCPTS